MVRGTLTVRVVCPFNNTSRLPQTWLPLPVFFASALSPCKSGRSSNVVFCVVPSGRTSRQRR